MKKLVLIICVFLGLLMPTAVSAVQFQASAPAAVPLGQAFRLVYTLNAAGGKDMRMADIPNFDVLAGPFEARSSSVQIVNGQVNTSTSVSYTYTLSPKKEGTFTIPAASIVVDQQRYTSNAVTIKVLPADKNAPATTQSKGGGKQSSGVDKLSDENIFVRAIPSRTRVKEQDYILVTYKLYSLVDIVGFTPNGVKLPDFKGFLKQEIELPKTSQLGFENYNGRNYSTVVLYQTLLYPQQAGTLQIEKASFEAIVRMKTQAQVRSIFDDFFNTYQDVTKKVIAPAIKVTVDKLPAPKPANFTGAVGSFSFNSSISSQQVAVNDAVTLKYTISGNGNLKMIKTPSVEFPTDFEVYDPKVNNNFKNTSSGVQGTKTIEYLIIPRSEGVFKIPSYTFSYFDVKSNSYKQITSPEYRIQVRKGSGANNQGVVTNYTNQEQLKLLGQDIHFIKTETPTVNKKNSFFFGTISYWLLIILPLLLAIILFIVYRKQLEANANVIMVKNRRANKVAIKRLKTANKYLQQNNKEAFYDEVLKALWGYLSDKLSIPVSSLNKENVEQELTKRKVDEVDIRAFMDVLSVCEFERYAPMHDAQAMDDLYKRTIDIITKFQESIK